MAKLSAMEKMAFSEARATFQALGLRGVSIKSEGLTIGLVQPESRHKNHVRVFVTQCGAGDTFKFKRGIIALHEKVLAGEFLTVPFRGRNIEAIMEEVVILYTSDTYGFDEEDFRFF